MQPSRIDTLLRPLHAWVFRDPHRRARKLLRFASTEASGGADLLRAAERTRDPLLRRLYLRHADDEHRHAELFRRRGVALLRSLPASGARFEANWLSPGERGLEEAGVAGDDRPLLAFLHLSERAAAQRFATYVQVIDDRETREIFSEILHDEAFHMAYTRAQLERISGSRSRTQLWAARLGRVWKAYLRVATAIAALFGAAMLRLQYFAVLPPFALLARRAMRREPRGFLPSRATSDFKSQY